MEKCTQPVRKAKLTTFSSKSWATIIISGSHFLIPVISINFHYSLVCFMLICSNSYVNRLSTNTPDRLKLLHSSSNGRVLEHNVVVALVLGPASIKLVMWAMCLIKETAWKAEKGNSLLFHPSLWTFCCCWLGWYVNIFYVDRVIFFQPFLQKTLFF